MLFAKLLHNGSWAAGRRLRILPAIFYDALIIDLIRNAHDFCGPKYRKKLSISCGFAGLYFKYYFGSSLYLGSGPRPTNRRTGQTHRTDGRMDGRKPSSEGSDARTDRTSDRTARMATVVCSCRCWGNTACASKTNGIHC